MAPIPCKNHPLFTYTGKEASPMGLGYCAEGCEVGYMMKGRDKNAYIVVVRNKTRIWERAANDLYIEPLAKEKVVMNTDADIKTMETKTHADEIESMPVPVPVPVPPAVAETKKPRKPRAKKEVTEVDGNVAEAVKVKKPRAKKAAPAEVAPTESDASSVASSNKSTRKPRAPTAYNLFIGAEMKKIRAENEGTGLSQKDIMKIATERWNEHKKAKAAAGENA